METRAEKDRIDVAVPQFKSEACESCFEDKELINVGRPIKFGVGRRLNDSIYTCPNATPEVLWRVPYHICLDCLKELRPVSDITDEMRHEYEKDIYYKVYDRVNFG
jgi:hypothetical protein